MVFIAVEGRGAIRVGEHHFDLTPHADDDLLLFSYSDRAAQEQLGLTPWR